MYSLNLILATIKIKIYFFLPKLEQLCLFHARDFCICVFVLVHLTGFEVDVAELEKDDIP